MTIERGGLQLSHGVGRARCGISSPTSPGPMAIAFHISTLLCLLVCLAGRAWLLQFPQCPLQLVLAMSRLPGQNPASGRVTCEENSGQTGLSILLALPLEGSQTPLWRIQSGLVAVSVVPGA